MCLRRSNEGAWRTFLTVLSTLTNTCDPIIGSTWKRRPFDRALARKVEKARERVDNFCLLPLPPWLGPLARWPLIVSAPRFLISDYIAKTSVVLSTTLAPLSRLLYLVRELAPGCTADMNDFSELSIILCHS